MKKIIIATVTVFTAIAFSAYTNGNAQTTFKANKEQTHLNRLSDFTSPTYVGKADLAQAD